MTIPKPPRRGPKPPKPIPRGTPPRRSRTRIRPRSSRPSSVAIRISDRQWSIQVRDLAGFLCEKCKQRFATDAHHIVGKKAHPELRHLLCNGIALCRQCHDEAHKEPVAFRAWFALAYSARNSNLLQYRRDFRDGVLRT